MHSSVRLVNDLKEENYHMSNSTLLIVLLVLILLGGGRWGYSRFRR